MRAALLQTGIERALSTAEQKYVTPGRGEELRLLLGPEQKRVVKP